jgi:hypothetical protein
MSLTSSDSTPYPTSAKGKRCFYCYDALDDPAVYWMGATSEIYLHPTCVAQLFIRLARDVHESECSAYYAKLREGQKLLDLFRQRVQGRLPE